MTSACNRSAWSILFLLLACVPGCNECDRRGCEALERPAAAAQVDRGIAGAVAYATDIVTNDCSACGFSSAELKVWSTPSLISESAAAQAVIDGGPPTLTFQADQRYERALTPGHYLVCALPFQCAAVTVPDKGVVTVNVMQAYGPGRLVVFEAGSSSRRTTGLFTFFP
jgi:hypothetical protein